MFNRILVPTNFSSCAHNAAKFACDMLRGQKATLVLMHACDPAECKSADEHERRAEQVQTSLSNEKAILMAYAPGIDIQVAVHEGLFTNMTTNFFENLSIELLVIGTDGVDVAERNPKSTNTELFLASHHRNMLIVPNNVSYMGFENILFTADYRYHLIDKQLDVIKEIMSAHDSKNYVVHVKKELESELKGSKIIEKQALEKEFIGQNPEFHEISSEKIEDGILKFVNSYNINLIALIPRKNTLSERIYKNSITKKLAERTNKPLLILN